MTVPCEIIAWLNPADQVEQSTVMLLVRTMRHSSSNHHCLGTGSLPAHSDNGSQQDLKKKKKKRGFSVEVFSYILIIIAYIIHVLYCFIFFPFTFDKVDLLKSEI